MATGHEKDRRFQAAEEEFVEIIEASTPRVMRKSSLPITDANRDPFSRSSSLENRKRLTEVWLTKAHANFEEFVASWNESGQEEVIEAIQALFLSATDDNDEVLERMQTIVSLLQENRPGQKIVRESGGLNGVCHFMGKNISDTRIQVAGCELLKAVAEDEKEVQDLINNTEGIDTILDAMTSHKSVWEIQNAGACALRYLTWGEENRKTMLRHGAIIDLVEALKAHSESVEVQENVVCTIAHSVFRNAAGREVSGQVGVVQVIVSAMKNHPDVVSLQAQCCFALRNLSWQCTSIHRLMYEHDADQTILDAMIKFPRIPGLQNQALAALTNLMTNNKYASNAGIKNKNVPQFLDILFTALHTFPTNAAIVRNSHMLLLTLCELYSISSSVESQEMLLKYPNAAKIIVRSVGTRERSIYSARSAAELMRCLGADDVFSGSVRDHGGLETMLDCLDQFAKSKTEDCVVLIYGLNVICSGNDDSKYRFNIKDGVLKLANLMTEHIKSENFATACCMLLDTVSNGQFEATASRMSHREEAVQAVVPAMMHYLSSAEFCEHACSVMIKIAASSFDDSNLLYKAGAKEIVEKSRVTHAGTPGVESLANQLLTLLVPASEGGREGREFTPRGNASARLRSRSRTVQTTQRSRSRMDRSKSRERGIRGPSLMAVDENSDGQAPGAESRGAGKPKKKPGSKPEGRKGRRGGGRAPILGMNMPNKISPE